MADNNVDKAINCYSLKDEKNLTAVKEKLRMIVGEVHQQIQKKGGLASIKIEEVSIEENTATVVSTLTVKNGDTKTDQTNLVKEDGAWKIKLE